MLILHLSDIHFRLSEINTTQDPNHHLRNELLRDVRRQCEVLGPPDVIVVSGDVAFAGHEDEFKFATEWLNQLCDACGGKMESIFVVPGNHDVVRNVADRNLVQLIHARLKSRQGDAELEEEIRRQLVDPDSARLLYESLSNYNVFALQFFCDLLPPDRTRARREVALNDGSKLRLWGLNTAFVSSSADKEGDIFVDPASMQITRDDGYVNMVVAHHHLSWIRQKRPLEDHLNDVAPLQVFGHVHTNRIDMNRDYIRLTASAAHPERHEPGWEPGYNFIEVNVTGTGGERRLDVRAHVRVWQAAPGGFQPKMDRDRAIFEHTIGLERWSPPLENVPSEYQPAEEDSRDATLPDSDKPVSFGAMTTLRDIGLRFYKLSFSKKSEIAGRLDLLEDEDVEQPDYERFRRVFTRAHERGKLEELAAAVREAEQH